MMVKALGGLKRGLAFVISAPAGTGKTTLVRMLCKEYDCVVESISFTTRDPRRGEVEGRDYYFISRDAFEQKIRDGEFLEYAEVFGSYYGTSKKLVESHQTSGKHVILVIDTQGALQLMDSFEGAFVFLKPPTPDELRKRLTSRKSETAETMEHRLSWAAKEMAFADRYDYQIVNENIGVAYEVFKSILIAEEHKTRNKTETL